MKVLFASKLIEELLLNRNNELSQFSLRIWEIIEKLTACQKIQIWITRTGLDKVHSFRKMVSIEDANNIVNCLESKFNIAEGSSDIYKNSLHYNSDFDLAIEVECAIEMGLDAIVTQSPQNYAFTRYVVPIWSIENFLNRYQLNDLLAASGDSCLIYNPKQLLLPWAEEKTSARFMIRNTISIIIKALDILKSEGFRGINQDDFSKKLGCSEQTIKSIIFDLKNFNLASHIGNRVIIHSHLLDTGKNEISQYLSTVLKDHVIVQQIYKDIEINKSITPWKLQEIIDKCSGNKNKKRKTLGDYRSRIISWILFAQLLEERGNKTYTIPKQENCQKFNPNRDVQQLELPLNLV